MQIEMILPLPPTGQRRARATSRGKFASVYKSGEQRKEERRIEAMMYEHRPEKPSESPVSIRIWAYLPIPASKSKKWKMDAAAGLIAPCCKPDADNLAKNILDVMNGVFFVDDKQVASLSVVKRYGDPARWEIRIQDL